MGIAETRAGAASVARVGYGMRAQSKRASPAQYAWASLRVTLGAIFLWAFADKAFGLGFATAPGKAWIAGGSPTLGFLKFATAGPLAPFYQAIAGNALVDVLFMAGLLGVGLALVLGMGLKIGGYAGAAMMMLMWSAHLPPENNPILDEHVVYAIALAGLALSRAGDTWGLGKWWRERAIVKRYPVLE